MEKRSTLKKDNSKMQQKWKNREKNTNPHLFNSGILHITHQCNKT